MNAQDQTNKDYEILLLHHVFKNHQILVKDLKHFHFVDLVQFVVVFCENNLPDSLKCLQLFLLLFFEESDGKCMLTGMLKYTRNFHKNQ